MLRIAVLLALVCTLTACGGSSKSASTSTATETVAPATTAATTEAATTASTETETTASSSGPASLLEPSTLTENAPATNDDVFTTTKGTFKVEVTRDWAPLGADRFYNLVKAKYFDGVRFFRVVPGFVVQFGIHPDPKIAKAWQAATIQDDPVKKSNVTGTLTFATAGPGTRTTQIFINLADNASLDTQGFEPFAKVTSGQDTIAKLYNKYREEPTNAQQQMTEQGDAFIKQNFPKLDRILTARIG
jgi:peptidyl-prolyl cis-trans isomerase A (cyclophilin A)